MNYYKYGDLDYESTKSLWGIGQVALSIVFLISSIPAAIKEVSEVFKKIENDEDVSVEDIVDAIGALAGALLSVTMIVTPTKQAADKLEKIFEQQTAKKLQQTKKFMEKDGRFLVGRLLTVDNKGILGNITQKISNMSAGILIKLEKLIDAALNGENMKRVINEIKIADDLRETARLNKVIVDKMPKISGLNRIIKSYQE